MSTFIMAVIYATIVWIMTEKATPKLSKQWYWGIILILLWPGLCYLAIGVFVVALIAKKVRVSFKK